MQIAVITFDGFNELDSFIAAGILNRMRPKGWKAFITCPTDTVTSMNGVTVQAERQLEFARTADAVLIGSGMKTREIVQDAAMLGRLKLDPSRQLVGAQCSGTLLLAKLGLLGNLPACTDLTTKPWVIEAGVRVLDQPFYAEGNVATAGGCLASQYLAAWILLRASTQEDAEAVLHYVAPVGQKDEYVRRAIESVCYTTSKKNYFFLPDLPGSSFQKESCRPTQAWLLQSQRAAVAEGDLAGEAEAEAGAAVL